MTKKKSPNSVRIRNSAAEFLTFAYQTGGDSVEVRVQGGTIWLSQKNMGELFTSSSDNIGLHLKNIFKEGELNAESVTEEFSVTATDGKITPSVITTSTPSSLWATVSIPSVPRSFGNGPLECCGITRCVAM